MKLSKKIPIILVMAILCGTLSGCSGKNDKKSDEFTYWIAAGQDASYYATYQENPCVEWLMKQEWGPKKSKISFDFWVPVSGSETENFNTLLSTGEYADILDMSRYSGSVVELYKDGVILDLTPYVEKYMPNYLTFLDAHPDLKLTATNAVDGEKKFLTLYTYFEQQISNWGGYCYRRDWIVKYGKNPIDGSSFSGEYVQPEGLENFNWIDNVVFPSGGNQPVYISDWEWMLDIFKTALEKEGISDGYCMSLYFPGYIETGDLVSAFGGGGGHWYKTPDDQMTFGATSDNFRTYLQCVNTWYKNGWIDTAFPEHAADMFYAVDDVKVRQGKVGLWYGLISQLMLESQGDDELTKDMVVYAAMPPINDIYGSKESQFVEPYCMYQVSLETVPYSITDKTKEKDLEALFSLFNYLYSDQGSMLKTFGLSKEQLEETQNKLYLDNGLINGAYEEIEIDGEIRFVRTCTGIIEEPVRLSRMLGLDKNNVMIPDKTMETMYKAWIYYKDTGNMITRNSFMNQLTSDESKALQKIRTNIADFLNKNVPNFIKGSKDPFNDSDWQAFVNAVNKYEPDKATGILQDLVDRLK